MKRLPWGLFGMILLVGLGERGFESRWAEFANAPALAWRLSDGDARNAAARADVLCLGDSLMKHGIQPRVIEAVSGRRAYNLAVPAAPPPAAYFLLRRALESGVKPGAVVVDYAHDMLAGGPSYASRNWPELLDLRDAIDLALTSRDATLFASWAIGRLSPSIRCRTEIRSVALSALGGQGGPYLPDHRMLARHWSVNLGAHVEAGARVDIAALNTEDQRRLLADAWWCHRVNRSYIRRLFQLATDRGVAVYWLVAPVSPALQARRDTSGADAKHSQFLRQIQAEFSGVAVVDARRSGYGLGEFVDPVHLNSRGASTLSHDLAAILRRGDSEGRRWVDLPAFRERMADVGVEDVSQSRIALTREAEMLRR